MMTDRHHLRAVCDLAVDRLVSVHGGEHDDSPLDPGLPPDLRIVTIGDAVFYVGSDPGEPTTDRGPDPDVVLLSSCAAIDIFDVGAAEAVIHEFRTDPATPGDLRISTTRGMELAAGSQVWIDQPLPVATSFDVVVATLDEFVGHALRLRVVLAPLDCSTSEEAMIRAGSGLHHGPLSYDLIDDDQWTHHPWLSQIVRNTDMDATRYLCLFGPAGGAALLFRDVTIEFEREDGSWESVRAQIPGPPMPARNWKEPGVAWWDANDGGPGPGHPGHATGRRRARVPTGWTGPPL